MNGTPGRPAAQPTAAGLATLLTDSLAGKRGGVLPWALLAVGSVASLAVNVAVAEPRAAGRGDRGLAVARAHQCLRAAYAPGPPWCS